MPSSLTSSTGKTSPDPQADDQAERPMTPLLPLLNVPPPNMSARTGVQSRPRSESVKSDFGSIYDAYADHTVSAATASERHTDSLRSRAPTKQAAGNEYTTLPTETQLQPQTSNDPTAMGNTTRKGREYQTVSMIRDHPLYGKTESYEWGRSGISALEHGGVPETGRIHTTDPNQTSNHWTSLSGQSGANLSPESTRTDPPRQGRFKLLKQARSFRDIKKAFTSGGAGGDRSK